MTVERKRTRPAPLPRVRIVADITPSLHARAVAGAQRAGITLREWVALALLEKQTRHMQRPCRKG